MVRKIRIYCRYKKKHLCKHTTLPCKKCWKSLDRIIGTKKAANTLKKFTHEMDEAWDL